MKWTRVCNPFTDAQLVEVGARFHRPEAAMLSTIALRAWCAEHRPDGVFRGSHAGVVVERAANWRGRRGALLGAMIEAGVVAQIDDGFVVDGARQWGRWAEDSEDDVDDTCIAPENETSEDRARRLKRARDRRSYVKKRRNSGVEEQGNSDVLTAGVSTFPTDNSDAAPSESDARSDGGSDASRRCPSPVPTVSVGSTAEIPTVAPSDKERARQNTEYRKDKRLKNTPLPPQGGLGGVGEGPDGTLSPEPPRPAALPAVPTAELSAQLADEHRNQRQAQIAARAAELEARLAALDESSTPTATTAKANAPTTSLKASMDKLRAAFAATEPVEDANAAPGSLPEPTPSRAARDTATGDAPSLERPNAQPDHRPASAPLYLYPATSPPEALQAKSYQAPATSPPPEPKPAATSVPRAATKPAPNAAPENPAAAFERFWAAWPKKVAKAEAQKAWGQLIRDRKLPPVGVLVAAIEAQRRTRQWLKDEGRYIPHPATWLRRAQWNDELPQLPSATECDRFGIPMPVACPENEPQVCRDEASMTPELAAKLARGEAIERVEQALCDGEQPSAADLDMLLPHVLASMIRRHGWDPCLAIANAAREVSA